jgi:hypothetical protein
MYKWVSLSLIGLVSMLVAPRAALAETEIELKNSFIEQIKDRATIDVNYTIDQAHERPNAPSKDGDLHASGRAPEVELAMVAEVMNAGTEKSAKAAVQRIHAIVGSEDPQPVKLSGFWRIWCEHGGNSKHVQGEALNPFDTTNPPHIFEIHPILELDGHSIRDSLKPINGFKTKDAEIAFHSYEGLRADITSDGDTTKITTVMGGYNYVEFIIEPFGGLHELDDGVTTYARVYSLDGDLLVQKRRMVFAKGTAPEKALRAMQEGDSAHVLGIPRIDLSLVSWRIAHADDRPEAKSWSLPYEMAIVAVYP